MKATYIVCHVGKTSPMPYFSLKNPQVAGPINLCISLQQILMKVHSFTKFNMINLSKTLAMTSAQCVMYVFVGGTCITVLECFSLIVLSHIFCR